MNMYSTECQNGATAAKPIGIMSKVRRRANHRSCKPLMGVGVVAETVNYPAQTDKLQHQDYQNIRRGPDTGGQSQDAFDCLRLDLGFRKNLEEFYVIGEELGKGGNGTVHTVTDKRTGVQYACKAIRKVLGEGFSNHKRATHVESIKREVTVLQKLKGCLNVVELHDVFEDEDQVYIVMEWCQGGELWHRIGESHYSERTVASYMRGVLRTLAVMHSHRILHRDIKPGNFMLLNTSSSSPLKAIDFGLAMPYEPDQLPHLDLGLEGTPWYMAPEALSSQVSPASDVWAAGVMAYQLLSGRFPFDDHRSPHSPAVSAIWRSILSDPLHLDKPSWSGISAEAKDFISKLLDRDVSKRLTAKQALEHPWLHGSSKDRSTGKQLARSVVQRIQRYAQGSIFKRTVLQAIAAELLSQQQLRGCDVSGSSKDDTSPGATVAGGAGGKPVVVAGPCSTSMQQVYGLLSLDEQDHVDKDTLASGLLAMGFKLETSELSRLLKEVDLAGGSHVDKAAFTASQMDWRELQQGQGEKWSQLVRRAFSAMDTDRDGLLRAKEMTEALKSKLPDSEVYAAVHQAMAELGCTPRSGAIDLDGFMRMLRFNSLDLLEMYDDRYCMGDSSTHRKADALAAAASIDRLNLLLQRTPSAGNSRHGLYNGASAALQDASVHSDVQSVVSDQGGSHHDSTQHSGIFNMDPSTHGQRQGRAGQTIQAAADFFRFEVLPSTAASAAAAAPAPAAAGLAPASFFRFDVGKAAAPAEPATAGFFRFDVGQPRAAPPHTAAAAAAAANAPASISAFRFDVDKEKPAPTAAAAATSGATTFFRFDVGQPPVQLAAPAAAGSTRAADAATNSLARAKALQGPACFDECHHGSSLYKNSVLVGQAAKCLATVHE